MLVDVISVFIRRIFAFNYPTYIRTTILVGYTGEKRNANTFRIVFNNPETPTQMAKRQRVSAEACNNYALLFIIAAIAATKGDAAAL